MKIRFEGYELDTDQKAVTGPDGPIPLRPQTFAVLCHLIEQAPAVVSRDALLDAVWGHQATSVSSVAQTIKELRQALGDSSSEPKLISTRRRLGYQFIGQIERGTDTTPPVEVLSTSAGSVDAIPPPSPKRPLWWGLSAVLLLGLVWLMFDADEPDDPLRGQAGPPTLAVAQMVNATEDPELNWLGPALETYLGHALVELGGFRVLVVDRVALQDEASLGEVDFLIEGRFLTAGVDGSRLLASLRRPGSSEILGSLESGLGAWDVAALAIDMAGAIRDRLGFAAPPGADSTAIRNRLPRQPSAQQSYFAALQALGSLESGLALQSISEARLHEPDNPRLDHLQALALKQRGDWSAARALSEQALSATQLWPRRDRLELEATAALLDFDYERAADNLQALTQFYPEADTNRRLVSTLIQAGRLRAAREALDSLMRQLPHDPQVALLEAELAAAEGDQEARLDAAQRAVLLARDEDLIEVLSAALLAEAHANIELARLDQAEAVLDDVFALRAQISDTTLAFAELSRARIHFQRGDLGPALGAAEQALALFELIPHPAGQAETLMVAGAIHDRAGRIEASLAVLEQAVEQFAALGDQRRLARSQVQLGVSLMRANQAEAAMERLEQGARHFRAAGDRQGEGAALINHATLLARNGRLIDAEPIFERSLEAFKDAGDLRGQAMALGNLAGIAGDRRDWRRSIELAEQALGQFEQLGAQTDIARVSYNLGLLHRRRGDLSEAERRIQQAAEAFAGQGASLMKSRVLTTLGALMVSMGRYEELDPILARVDALDIEDPAELSVYHAVLGERALRSQDIPAAQAHFDQAYELMAAIGADNHLLVSRLNRARVDLARGRLISAEQAARELLIGFGEIRNTTRQIDALMLLSEALLEQGRMADAAAQLSRAEDLLEQAPDAEQALRLALLRSRVSEPALAAERLDWVEKTAGEQGFLPLLELGRNLRQASP
ncbi:MAG: tetratricopeptide repeat protein [Wenzhouxiangella sp.]